MIHPYSRIRLRNEEEPKTDRQSNLNEPQRITLSGKKKKKPILFLFGGGWGRHREVPRPGIEPMLQQ